MKRFEKGHQLRFRRVHGETHSVHYNAIRNKIPGLLRIIRNFAEKDVWKADEFDLFNCQHPTWSLSSTTVSDFKKEKNRLTFLASCNKFEFQRIPLMIIDNFERPRTFNRKYGKEVKAKYSRCLHPHAFGNIESSKKTVYQVDVLAASR